MARSHSRMPKLFIPSARQAQIVLIGGLLISLVVWAITALSVSRSADQEFERQASTAAGLIERRFERYTDLLHGVHGLFGHQRDVSRLNFNRYVAALDLPHRFPGVRSMQFVQRVLAGEKDQFENVVRSDYTVSPVGHPEFRIHPPAERAEYWIINYVEPMAGNERAFGLDLMSRDPAREAAARARDTGDGHHHQPLHPGAGQPEPDRPGGVFAGLRNPASAAHA